MIYTEISYFFKFITNIRVWKGRLGRNRPEKITFRRNISYFYELNSNRYLNFRVRPRRDSAAKIWFTRKYIVFLWVSNRYLNVKGRPRRDSAAKVWLTRKLCGIFTNSLRISELEGPAATEIDCEITIYAEIYHIFTKLLEYLNLKGRRRQISAAKFRFTRKYFVFLRI